MATSAELGVDDNARATRLALMRGGMGVTLAVLAITATTRVARAQCATDRECKGSRICEAGRCVAPPASAVPGAAAAAPSPVEAPAAAVPAPVKVRAPVKVEASVDRERFFEENEGDKPRKVKKRIGNPRLMVGGIVLTSAAPIVLVAGVASSSCSYDDSGSSRCDIGERVLAFGLISLALIGAGVPMIVIGAKRVPVQQVALGPLLGPGLSGLQLQLRL